VRIPSGVVDQYVYLIAVDSTDLKTRETGLTSFTVYRDKNGGGATAMTTPTVTEVDATNLPGVYKLLCDEDMTIGAGNDSEEMVYHITQASMAPVTRTIAIYRRTVSAGYTLGVASDGDISGNVDGSVAGSVASVSGAVGSVTGAVGSVTAAVATDAASRAASKADVSGLATSASITALNDFDYIAENVTLAAATHTGAVIPTVSTLTGHTAQTGDNYTRIGAAGAGLTDLGGMSTGMKAEVNVEAGAALVTYDGPTNAGLELRTPTAAQLAYITANSATGMPVTFTTAGGSTTVAVLNLVDGASASATNDQLNGRLLVFTDGTLKGCVTDITDYVGSTTTATITAIPFAPTASHNARLI